MTNPITIHPDAARPAYQGDVQIRRVSEMPEGAIEVARQPNGALLVAHSETGHHHEIAAVGSALWAVPGDTMRAYLRVPAGDYADVVHRRPWDTHQTLRLLADGGGDTIYEIGRQREYVPDGWRRVED